MNKLIVGLTGGIASGKSRAADKLKELGCSVIDTDAVSREVVEAGTDGAKRLEELFPSVFENGHLNRRALRQEVFENPQSRELLNAVLHPLIEARCNALIEAQEGLIIVVVPLLFETGFDRLADKTVAVSCNENVRIQRLIKRDNIDVALARAMIASQLSDAARNERADYVIFNDGDGEQFDAAVAGLYEELKGCLKNP